MQIIVGAGKQVKEIPGRDRAIWFSIFSLSEPAEITGWETSPTGDGKIRATTPVGAVS